MVLILYILALEEFFKNKVVGNNRIEKKCLLRHTVFSLENIKDQRSPSMEYPEISKVS